jgi:hypothetical protein
MFPLRDDIAVISEDVIMSEVILDISRSLDALIAQPDDDPGPIHKFLFSGETEHDGIFPTSGATTVTLTNLVPSTSSFSMHRK